MTQKDLKYLIAESIGAQSKNNELVFRVFTKKIANRLRPGEAVRIENVGTFKMPEAGLAASDMQNKLIFLPSFGENIQSANSHFISIPIMGQKESREFSPDNIFDIGVSKPIASTKISSLDDSETLELKDLNDKIENLISESEKLESFDIWSNADVEDSEPAETEVAEFEPEEDEVAELTELAGPGIQDEEIDNSLELPDFKSMEDETEPDTEDISSEENLDIVPEDDIIIPGVERPLDIEEQPEEEIEEEYEDEIGTDESLPEEDIEELQTDEFDDTINFESPLQEELSEENSEIETEEEQAELTTGEESVLPDLEEEAADPLFDEESPDENNIEEQDADSLLDEENLDVNNIEEQALELSENDIEEALLNEDTAELDALFSDAEDKTTVLDEDAFEPEDEEEIIDDELNVGEEDQAEEIIEDELNEITNEETVDEEDINFTDGEIEVEHPEFEEEGIETLSVEVEETDAESEISENEIEENEEIIDSDEEVDTAEEEVDSEEEITDEETSDEEELVEEESSEEEILSETVTENLNEEDSESEMDNEYSKLNTDKEHSKASLGKGFWISVMIFVVVVVVGAYMYLFVYDEATENSTAKTEVNAEQPETPTIAENNGEKVTEAKADDVKNDVAAQKVETEKPTIENNVKPPAQTGLYRDGTNEKMLPNLVFNKDGLYSVQMASFKTQRVAEKEAKRLEKLGYETFIVKAFVQKLNSEYYRVRVGYFNTKKEADDFAASVKK